MTSNGGHPVTASIIQDALAAVAATHEAGCQCMACRAHGGDQDAWIELLAELAHGGLPEASELLAKRIDQLDLGAAVLMCHRQDELDDKPRQAVACTCHGCGVALWAHPRSLERMRAEAGQGRELHTMCNACGNRFMRERADVGDVVRVQLTPEQRQRFGFPPLDGGATPWPAP